MATMGRPTPPLVLTDAERNELQRLTKRATVNRLLAFRASTDSGLRRAAAEYGGREAVYRTTNATACARLRPACPGRWTSTSCSTTCLRIARLRSSGGCCGIRACSFIFTPTCWRSASSGCSPIARCVADRTRAFPNCARRSGLRGGVQLGEAALPLDEDRRQNPRQAQAIRAAYDAGARQVTALLLRISDPGD